MHSSGKGKTRPERVRQSLRREPSVLDYGSYIPIGNAVMKLRRWERQGARIFYLSSHENLAGVGKDKYVLQKFKFPTGGMFYRKEGIGYAAIVKKILHDILIEDDCESIGKHEMAITKVRVSVKKKIMPIVVKEFAGIDRLPDDVNNRRSLK